jgi:toxin ParE1/3/4
MAHPPAGIPARWYLSRRAQRNLDEAWDYIATEAGAARADVVIDRIIRRIEALADFPYSGRSRDDLRRGWRSAVARPYVIYYRVSPSGVYVLRVLHGRRDQDASL